MADKQGRRRIIYHPPKREVIDAYARRVCERLSEKYGTSIYANPEVIWGFARFLELSAVILAKHLSTSCETEDKVAKKPK